MFLDGPMPGGLVAATNGGAGCGAQSAARGYLPTKSSLVTKQPSELKMFKTLGSRVLYHRLETGAHLIMISLLSLGLWAAIWAIAASLI